MSTYETGNIIYGAFGVNDKDNKETKLEYHTPEKSVLDDSIQREQTVNTPTPAVTTDDAANTEDFTLAQLFEDWNINVNYVRNAKTTWTFTANIQRHILSFFGKSAKLRDITTKHILEYLAFLKTNKTFSNNTINKHRTHLMTVFEYMVLHDETYDISVNPVKKIKPLKEEPFYHAIYQPEEAKEVLNTLKASDDIGLEVAVSIALYCGCRREEVCALRWEHVDMTNRVMTICEVRTTAGKDIVKMNHTKNNTVRQIGIPDALHEVLTRAKEQQKKDRKNYGSLYQSKPDFVLREKDGAPWHPNNVTKRWARFIRYNHFRYIRYHDLRHTNLSLLMTKMSAVDVAKLGGHKKVSTTTNIYGHSFNNALETGVKTINELL